MKKINYEIELDSVAEPVDINISIRFKQEQEYLEYEKLDIFQEELRKVNLNAHLAFIKDNDYGRYEYSIHSSNNTYVVRCSSLLGAQSGAVHLLRELGFYYFTPSELWHKYPKELGVVEVEKREPSFVNKEMFLTYGYGPQAEPAWGPYRRFLTLNGMDQGDGSIGHSWGNI